MNPNKSYLFLLSSLPLGKVSLASPVNEVALMCFIYQFKYIGYTSRIYRVYQQLRLLDTTRCPFLWSQVIAKL